MIRLRLWLREPHAAYPGRRGGRPNRPGTRRAAPPPRSGGKPPAKAFDCLTVVALSPLFLLFALATLPVRQHRTH